MQTAPIDDTLVKKEEAKLELYALLGQGYQSIKEGRVSDIEDVEERIMQRRGQRSQKSIIF